MILINREREEYWERGRENRGGRDKEKEEKVEREKTFLNLMTAS